MERARIVSELARLGSIDALIAAHDALTAEEVGSALRYASDLVAAEQAPAFETSPLYRAYNGFMLGLFLAGSWAFRMRDEADRRRAALARVLEFLLEFRHEFGKELPPFDLDAAELEDAIDASVRELDPELATFYQLGLTTFRYVVLGAGAEDAEEAQTLLGTLGYPPMIFRSSLDERMKAVPDDERTWQELMTTCLRFARELVIALPEEADTCFVAMPFKPPYEERYLNFYRLAARRMKWRSIRAWGGLGDEEHQELLLALIAKSGTLLGDVSEPNANVALEIGFALGQNKMAFLVAEQGRWKNAANIQLDWVFPYRVEADEPGPDEIERAGLYFTALQALRRPGSIPSWGSTPIDVLQQLAEIFAPQSPAAGDPSKADGSG